jgi:hypothetical protein
MPARIMSALLERYDRLPERLAAEVQALYGPRLVACAVFGSVGRGTPALLEFAHTL